MDYFDQSDDPEAPGVHYLPDTGISQFRASAAEKIRIGMQRLNGSNQLRGVQIPGCFARRDEDLWTHRLSLSAPQICQDEITLMTRVAHRSRHL